MADNYGSGDDYGNDAGDDNMEEAFSEDSEKSQDYQESHPLDEEPDRMDMEEEQEEESMQEESSQMQNYEIVQDEFKDEPNLKRITSPFMTKFEKAKIIGVRAVQISKNAPLYLKN